MGLVSLMGQVVVVTFLTYFLLLSGDTFRRKVVKIAGPSLSSKKITVEALDEITQQIQRYLLVQLVSSIAVGLVTGLAFWSLGLNHVAVWAIRRGRPQSRCPTSVPRWSPAGPPWRASSSSATIDMALAVAGVSLVIHTISGNLIVPWLTSKASSMNAVAVFVCVLAWGWLWGLWGLLLGIPIMMVVKAVCDRVDDLKPVGELLGS